MKPLQKFTVLGASSPFTLEFINCICAVNSKNNIGPYHLMLSGRNAENLESIFHYANFHLTKIGWKVDFSTDINRAIEGASIILHQNRYGGHEGRLEDELFTREMRVPADETLGPSGLKSAIRMAPHLKVLARKILSLCPDVLVINLTNPLSIAVSILHQEGILNTIGICELPLVTLEKVARVLRIPYNLLQWEYSGLNHRGFIHHLKFEEKNLLPLFLKNIAETGFEGFPCSEIEDLEAIPLKYFSLFSCHPKTYGRAGQVKVIGDRILKELSLNPLTSPQSLKDRTMDWYKKGVIPVLQAINSPEPNLLIINKAVENNLTIESKAAVSNATITLTKPVIAPIQVNRWVSVFTDHEKAVFKAATEPSLININHALNADPLVINNNVNPISESLINYVLKEHDQTNA